METVTDKIIEAARLNGYNMAYIDLHDILIEMKKGYDRTTLLKISNRMEEIKAIREAAGMTLPPMQ